jgi:hypothetical protein
VKEGLMRLACEDRISLVGTVVVQVGRLQRMDSFIKKCTTRTVSMDSLHIKEEKVNRLKPEAHVNNI